jgi:hypothetical protein
MSRCFQSRIWAGCVGLACLLALPGFGWSPWATRLLSQARERVLYVTVVDRATDTPVRELRPDGLIVREDGVRREVLRVTTASSPMPIAVIIDNSQPAAPAIADLRRALTPFLTAIDGLGPIAIVTVADRPTIVADYTTSQKALQDVIGRLFHSPNSGATLLDAISDVARGLGKKEDDRAAIVVVTTENIEYSQLHYRDVLERLRDSGASLHAIVLTNPARSNNTDEARSRAIVLDRGPAESGGVRRDVLTSMAFEMKLKDVAAMLKSQHRVTYARPESLIPPEKIEVSAVSPAHVAYGAPARGQVSK